MKIFFTELNKTQKIGFFLLILSIATLSAVGYVNSNKREVPIIFSEKEFFNTLWENYKLEYIEADTGRTLDKQQGNITTSEGQSYTMLRAVWVSDRETFNKSYKWTKDILRQKDSNLHSWLFGERSDGSYGILVERGGNNAATDADSDIALALIFAYEKWRDTYYLDEAKLIIKDIWDKEVVLIDGKPVLVSNDIEKNNTNKVIVNPSYFSPYAYRIFKTVDPANDWIGLATNSYAILKESSKLPLDVKKSVGIPPDWIDIDMRTGNITASQYQNLSTLYSFDALRIPWRIALDWQWFKEPLAKEYLDSLSFFSNEWSEKQSISSSYSHSGEILESTQVPSMYGGIIGYFLVSDPEKGKEIYEQKLQILYNPDTNSWKKTLSYYDDNWAWFGIGLYNNLLPNLAINFSRE